MISSKLAYRKTRSSNRCRWLLDIKVEIVEYAEHIKGGPQKQGISTNGFKRRLGETRRGSSTLQKPQAQCFNEALLGRLPEPSHMVPWASAQANIGTWVQLLVQLDS